MVIYQYGLANEDGEHRLTSGIYFEEEPMRFVVKTDVGKKGKKATSLASVGRMELSGTETKKN